MARRTPYTRVEKSNEVRAQHVRGMGDVVFKGFQCLKSECQQWQFVRKDTLTQEFEVPCQTCNFILRSGDETRFYDYILRDIRDDSIIRQGTFSILHDDYLAEAQEYKYCIICNTMKPLDLFSLHGSRVSGRQSECRSCKQIYNNDIKNATRLPDQHREAAQKRRMYLDLSGAGKIDSTAIFDRFNYCCFKCGKDLRSVTDQRERPLDHTLPVFYLWPLSTQNATLLCREHNGEKSGKWPSQYYSDEELKRLSILTGLEFALLTGKPTYNPAALEQLKSSQHVDALLAKYSAYLTEIIKLRNRLLRDTSLDFFAYSQNLSETWRTQADEEYRVFLKKPKTAPDTDDL